MHDHGQNDEEHISIDPFVSKEAFEVWTREIARQGAREALMEVGLGDEYAGNDIKEIRIWIGNVRGLKRVFGETSVKIFTTAFWVLLIGGLIAYFKGKM